MSETKRRDGRIARHIAAAPVLGAILLLSAIGASAAILAYWLADFESLAPRHQNVWPLFECVAGGATGAVAIIAAFRMHVRGRATIWRTMPLAMLAIWQFASIYASRDVPIVRPAEQLFFGHSPHSVLFVLAVSIPIVIAQFLLLRLHNLHLSGSVAALVGLGAAAISTCLMRVFYPFDMSLADIAMIFAAIGIVVGSSAFATQLQPRANAEAALRSGGRAIKRPARGSK